MNSQALQLTQEALYLVLILSAPPIVAASVVGLVIALIQAATQLQEQTFQYAAKFFSIVLVIFVTSAFMGGLLFSFTDRIMSEFPAIVRR
jgi:type III secretion protein S